MKVFPIKTGAKFPPLIKGWPTEAVDPAIDPEKIRSWGSKFPGCNWAVSCEGMVVIDVDVRSGGVESLEFLEMLYDFPETYRVTTPTGGQHIYYRLPENHPGVPNSAGKVAKGIDIKSTGGYVLGSGSAVESGKYSDNGTAAAFAPDWLALKCGTTVPKIGIPVVDIPDGSIEIVNRASEWLASQPKGEGAYATSCGLRDFGLSAHQALQALATHDGRPLHVLESKVKHAYAYAQGEPGAKAIDAGDFEVLPASPPPPPAKGPRRVKALAGEMGHGRPYLVKGLLQRGSYALLYGAPGEGKTFVAMDIAYHVAAGLEWMGRRTRQGLVLYLAYEGQGGLPGRAEALLAGHSRDDIPLYIEGANYRFREPVDRQALADLIAQLPEKPALIVIDTLARAAVGWDENSAADMGEFIKSIDFLRDRTGACVLVVHHSGKNKANGARGSSALLGAIDTELEIGGGIIRSTKQRDIEEAEPIGFSLKPVGVGMDEDGDMVYSCTVEPREIGPVWTRKKSTLPAWTVLSTMRVQSAPVDLAAWREAVAPEYKRRQGISEALRDLKDTKHEWWIEERNGMLHYVEDREDE